MGNLGACELKLNLGRGKFCLDESLIMIVNKHIIEFITDLNTNFLEWQRYEDKIRAFRLMKIAAWGDLLFDSYKLLGITV